MSMSRVSANWYHKVLGECNPILFFRQLEPAYKAKGNQLWPLAATTRNWVFHEVVPNNKNRYAMNCFFFILSVNIRICLIIELWHYNIYIQITQRSVCSGIYKLGVWYLWLIYFARKIIITVIDLLLTKSHLRTQRTIVTVMWVLAEI